MRTETIPPARLLILLIAPFGAALLACALPALGEGDHIYDRDNQYGAVNLADREQPKFPMFDNAKQLGAVAVADRDRSPWQADGIRVRNYLIFPEVDLETRFDDNLFGSHKATRDVRQELTGVVRFDSQMPRHVLDFMFGGKLVRFYDNEELSHAGGFANMRGRLDIDHAHAFVGNFLTNLDHEERRDGETPQSAKYPIARWTSSGDVGFVRTVGRLSTLLGATAEHREYDSTQDWTGATLPQSFRNTDIFSAYGKARYQFSPGYTLTARARVMREENAGTPAFNRSGSGADGTVGIDMELTRLVKLSLDGGYLHQNYDHQTLADINTAIYEARLQWLITPLITMYASARREATTTSFLNASGRISHVFTGRLEYEPLRNLVLSAGAEYRLSDYAGTTRHDELIIARLGATYYFNKRLHFTLNYEHQELSTNASGFGFEGNRITAGVKYRF